uniref:Uncharacterized protein n=1 Tax=Arundo donax TaxID=35708 RepID=A0A0A9HUG6_ARUDO
MLLESDQRPSRDPSWTGNSCGRHPGGAPWRLGQRPTATRWE